MAFTPLFGVQIMSAPLERVGIPACIRLNPGAPERLSVMKMLWQSPVASAREIPVTQITTAAWRDTGSRFTEMPGSLDRHTLHK